MQASRLIKVLHQVTEYDKAHYPNDAVERLQNEEVILYIFYIFKDAS